MSVSGRISAASAFTSTPMMLTSQTATVPFGRSFVAVPGLVLPTQSYLYELKLSNGRTVLTLSDRGLAVGDCVTLWHAGAADLAEGENNFVQGTLERGGKCS